MSLPLSPINLQERPHVAACGCNVHYGTDLFRLTRHWSLHAYRYHARVRLADSSFEIFPGSITLVPVDTTIEYRYQGLSTHIYAHFSLPKLPQQAESWLLPVFYDLGEDFSLFEKDMETVAQTLRVNRLRAEIKLWDLLWKLADYGQNPHSALHPSLEKALSFIEVNLGTGISVTLLARAVGVSHSHLTRLFYQYTGLTAVAYIRQQRAKRAKHLLQNTTISLKAIANQVHVADLQSFSALIKKETGHPPTYWRQKTQSQEV